ncbi:MmgE/PrpD family protein [Aliiroseovarius sp. S1339]|uniref:MmgE/PrpD family protein n=1 Tax=Aliiroseovarius sp. S1339 TaxID=2936990 RepID=UPI0020BFC78C|nr:MmgE/PrpD family protein [Aliiroseovarius sp. S1339]MCK8462326.1 MmgE/PrpD family protein [Aliiroseovarius sp. S1339]
MGQAMDNLVRFGVAPVMGDQAHDAREMMALSLLDWATVAIAGADEPVARIICDMAVDDGGGSQASVVGRARKLPVRAAAMVNGTASHALDYDDTHFAHIGHPSVAAVPAALAIAEWIRAPGSEMLDAALVGVEGSIRLGRWLGRNHYQTGFHQTATAGAFGATLAAGRLLALSADQLTQALGLCATRAAGLKSQFGTMGKPYHAGLAAQTGVEVARAAKAGFISAPDGIDGPQGFGPTHSGEADAIAFDDLGRHWDILTISHKFHACCHGTHAMLEALSDIDCAAADVAEIQLWTHPRWLSVCNIPHPKTGLEVKFSYAHCAAMALSGVDTTALASFSDQVARDPALVALASRVHVLADDNIAETAARVEVTLQNGAVLNREGNLNAPMSLADRRVKLEAKSRALLGARADQVIEAIGSLPDMDALCTLLRAP